MAAFNKSQEYIDGKVVISLYKGNVIILGRDSPTSLYNKECQAWISKADLIRQIPKDLSELMPLG